MLIRQFLLIGYSLWRTPLIISQRPNYMLACERAVIILSHPGIVNQTLFSGDQQGILDDNGHPSDILQNQPYEQYPT